MAGQLCFFGLNFAYKWCETSPEQPNLVTYKQCSLFCVSGYNPCTIVLDIRTGVLTCYNGEELVCTYVLGSALPAPK
jgi:hypothetical protein